VFLPSKDDQEEIASILDTVDTKIALIKRKQDIQEELFRTLLHQLMTGQTRVNDIDLTGLPDL
jgi:type I restriction enzyme S subunit